jgi:hypothetical protein
VHEGLAWRLTWWHDEVVERRSGAAVQGGLCVGWRRSRPMGQRAAAAAPPPWPSLPSVVVDLLHQNIACRRAGMAARLALDLPAFVPVGWAAGVGRLRGGSICIKDAVL